jgi:hypothetical protein
MANMSYCRFQNTFLDLQDCVNQLGAALDEGLTYDEFFNELSENEQYYFKRLLTRAQDLISYADELRTAEPIEDR